MDLFITENNHIPEDGELVLDLKEKKIKIISKELNYSKEQVEYIYNNFFKDLEKEKKHINIRKSLLDYIINEFYIVRDILEFSKEIYRLNTINVYRGQRDSTWKLLPSIHRKRDKGKIDMENHEKKLYKNIRKQNHSEFKRQDEFINEIIKMQHYGVPTPLMDWTTNPLIALFFATSSGGDGKIFIADFKEQIKVEFDTDEFKKYSDFLEKIYKESETKKLENNFLEKTKIIFIETINENDRIRAQKGLFSFDTLPYLKMFFEFSERIEHIYSPYLEKLKTKAKETIEKNLKNKVQEYKDERDADKIFDGILSSLQSLNGVYPAEIGILVPTINEFKSKILKEIENFISINLTQNIETKSIIILEEDKEKIKKELEYLYGIDSSTVYPDLQGYIEYVKENF
ncbi:FRG domain-containing protein [Cetobacterium sp.]|uniref:FRG domain-containing protein n=1 Tax=Cetobacterium sp. TaxID=2071632 RepID=UPI003F3D5578